ncbi:Reverse transcriptase-like [Sesbania bispinosa]|nr:Reverse transcriptase-like [Sesbania bispinosa]
MEVFRGVNRQIPNEGSRSSWSVQWNPSPSGWYMVNTDGVLAQRTGMAACGGVIWDCWGRFIAGFANEIGEEHILVAELLGISRGITLDVQKKLN